MAKDQKLSTSKASGTYFTLKAAPLPAKMTKQLSEASVASNEKISHSNQVYAASNSHASY